jgi:hypothetical protein
VVTSRSEADAVRVTRQLEARHPDARIRPAHLDQFSRSFAEDLRRLNPGIVLHTAGPYQGQDYRVAKACLSCGSHYIDLADGREFVEGFSCLNDSALQRDVLLISGASTLPGLSSAVVDSLKDRFAQIHDIEICIAPAHQTPRGVSTIAAVLSYCGKPFQVLVDGIWVTKYGWQDLRIQHHPQLGTRLSGTCDVPDLALFPKCMIGLRTVTFHAALEAPWEQLALWCMAWLTRFRVVKDWARYATLFQRVSNRLISLGSDAGGMRIRLTGTDNANRKKVCTWYLTAGQNHGPEIPCSPALVLARKLARNQISQRGAYPCLGMMSFSELTSEMRNFDISWNVTD